MDISLKDAEIKDALEQYVNGQGINTEGKKVVITLKSGRNGNGPSATVVISNTDDDKNNIEPKDETDGGSGSIFSNTE